jgi:hypothetical protein
VHQDHNGSDLQNPSVTPDILARLKERLTPEHLDSLTVGSGIAPEVILTRGYESFRDPAVIATKGFEAYQCRVPALGMPSRNTCGLSIGWQIRPDTPRQNANNKPIKYESPPKQKPFLDLSPGVDLPQILQWLRDPAIPILLTEGAKKADSVMSAAFRAGIEICAISLPGVWGWLLQRHTLDDWRDLALESRVIYLGFDSDIMHKSSVHLALTELVAFLTRRQAKPRIIYLPHGADNTKVGCDDYLVTQGNTLAGMLDLAEECLRPVTPAEIAETLLKEIEDTPPDERSLEVIFSPAVLETFAALPWYVWAPMKPRIKSLVPEVNLNDLDKAKSEAKRSKKRHQAPRAAAETADHRPTIRITTDMARVVDAGIKAICDLPDAPHVWQRGGQLCIIGSPPHPPAGVKREPGTPLVLTLSPARLTELASMSARWEKFGGEDWYETLPPDWFSSTVLGRPSWPFPVLEGIIDAPTLRANGTILDTPGYDTDSGLYLARNGTKFLRVRDSPTQDHAKKALNALAEPFEDFPFQEPHHRSAALAAVLSLVGRHAIDGPVPLSGVTAPRAGSGKGLLVDVISLIATGRTATRWAYTENEEEQRKRLLSFAMAGDRLVCIDNVAVPIGSAALDMALTSRSISDRLLGVNKTGEAPWHAVMFATGNNLNYRGDTARRVVPIVIDPQLENPEQRTGFKKVNILQWVTDHRPRLLAAALTALRAYIVAGQPQQQIQPYGSFDAWSALIRGCLVWCGWPDPNASREYIEAENDLGYEELSGLLAAWEAVIGTQEITLQRLIQRIDTELKQMAFAWKSSRYGEAYEQPDPEYIAQWIALRDALGRLDSKYDGEHLNAPRLGYALRSYKDRIIDGKKFKRGVQKENTGWPWSVVTVQSTSKNPEPPSDSQEPLVFAGDDSDDSDDDFSPKSKNPYLPLTPGDDGDDRSQRSQGNSKTYSVSIEGDKGRYVILPDGQEISSPSSPPSERPLKDLPLSGDDSQKLSSPATSSSDRVHIVF